MPLHSTNCETCGSSFTQTRNDQKFCCRKCYNKKINLKRKGPTVATSVTEGEEPVMICAKCKQSYKLDFNPTSSQNYRLWYNLACPHCHHEPNKPNY